MRSLEEIKEYLETEGICACDIPRLFMEHGLVMHGNSVKITNKTITDFDKWYDNEDDAEKESVDSDVESFTDHLSALWINIHDISVEAVENPKDIEVQIRSFVKLNAITRCLMDALSVVEILEDEE
jgi:hypothetical protein